MSEDHSLIPEIAWYGVSRALPAAFSFATIWLLVRALGRSEYGYFAIVYAAANAASTIACGWLTQGLLRFVPGLGVERLDLRATLAPAAALAFAVGTLLAVIALAVLGEPWSSARTIAAGVLLVSGFTAHAVTSAIFQAAGLPRTVAEVEVVRAVSALVLATIACSWLGLGFLGAIVAIGLSMVFSSCWGARVASRVLEPKPVPRPPPADALSLMSLVRFGAPMSAWFALSLSFPLVDRTMIERSLSIEATGLYAALYDLGFRSCGFLLMPVVLALHPRIMRTLHHEGPLAARRLLSFGIAIEIATSVAIVGAVWVSSSWLLEIGVGGDTGRDGAFTLILLCASGCIWNIALLAHKPLEIDQRTSSMLVLMAIALLIAMLGNLIGLPRYGLLAAAASTLAAGVFYAVGSLVVGLVMRPLQARG